MDYKPNVGLLNPPYKAEKKLILMNMSLFLIILIV